ncbi:hypothetical protein AQUCO_00700490v1 [Aquilegia coerulea]|uniref:Avr9/Cf-9 rapidly elicited protein n=1 Tax=Aquilegia coerulea TaxID=218851 RepID=A0A2G5EKC3_AQUCA|nr:hypothetical protein AQUCO_00700490v1 [Aquilegia coerulea]
MNSIFSSFDVLCGEFFLHQKVGFFQSSSSSSSTATSINKVVDVKNTQSSQNERSSEGNSQASKPSQQKQRRGPRFAPELDGLNCFETIIC